MDNLSLTGNQSALTTFKFGKWFCMFNLLERRIRLVFAALYLMISDHTLKSTTTYLITRFNDFNMIW